jgi:hypothetical protein
MRLLKRRTDSRDAAGLRAELARLSARNREQRSERAELRLRALRHELGRRLIDAPPAGAAYPDPAGAAPPAADGLPEVAAAELTPELLRAGILRDGCVLVRGLVARDQAVALADGIDRAFAQREQPTRFGAGYYDEFVPDARFPALDVRAWVQAGGGLLAADSPRLLAQLLDVYEHAGVTRLVEGYLGEPALLSAEKTTLRRAEPTVGGAWHQDGHFLGPVRALNLWLALSRCGDVAPGLDIVPRRLDGIVAAGVDGVFLDYQVTAERAAALAAPKRVVRPIFEPGDALLFDEVCLHQTASEATMPHPRHAVESWFFGASGFPKYAPIAV